MKLVISTSMIAMAMLALAVGVFAGGDKTNHFLGGRVLSATKDTFDTVLAENPYALVAFHAVWCGHCKRLAPAFVEASEQLEGTATLVEVELENAGSLTQKYGVRGFPTIKVFREGEPTPYTGGRDVASLVSYMKKNAGPALKPVEGAAEDVIAEAEDVVVIGYVEEDSAAHATLTAVAKKHREQFGFAATHDADARAAACGDAATECVEVRIPGTHVHPKFDGEPAGVSTTTALDSVADLDSFVWEASVPLVGQRTKDTEERFSRTGKPLVTVYAPLDYKNNLKKTNYWANRVRKVAANFPQYTFAMADSSAYSREMADFGLNSSTEVSVSIRDAVAGKFVMEEEFSGDAFAAFITAFSEDTVEPFIKSADVPDAYVSEYVTGLTGKNFRELVDNNKDVNRLVAFTELWCGHCKKLVPAYEELAKRYAEDDNVMIARVEVSKNDIGSFDGKIRGFPSIYFIPAGSSEPIKYTSGRDVDSFVDFIEKNAA